MNNSNPKSQNQKNNENPPIGEFINAEYNKNHPNSLITFDENDPKAQKNSLENTPEINQAQSPLGEKKEIFDNYIQKQFLLNNFLNSNMPLLNGLIKNQSNPENNQNQSQENNLTNLSNFPNWSKSKNNPNDFNAENKEQENPNNKNAPQINPNFDSNFFKSTIGLNGLMNSQAQNNFPNEILPFINSNFSAFFNEKNSKGKDFIPESKNFTNVFSPTPNKNEANSNIETNFNNQLNFYQQMENQNNSNNPLHEILKLANFSNSEKNNFLPLGMPINFLLNLNYIF